MRCKVDGRREAAVQRREPDLALSDALEGWDGERGGSLGREAMCV